MDFAIIFSKYKNIRWQNQSVSTGFKAFFLSKKSANIRTCGKIKGDANQASHKLERGCQLGFNGFNRDHDFLWNSMAFFFKQNLQI